MAPVTFTNLANVQDTTAGTSIATGSISPTGDRLLFAAIHARISTGSTQPPTPTVTGNGLTWELIHATNGVCNFDATGTDRSTLFLFRAMGASPSSGAVTADFGSTTITFLALAVDQSDANVDTSGSNGAGAIVQTAKTDNGNGVSSISATLSAFGDATNNAAYGQCGHQHGNEATSAGSGFTLLADMRAVGLTSCSGGTEYRSGEDTSVDMSWTTATNRSGIIAVEVKAAAGTVDKTGSDTGTGADAASVAAALSAGDSAAGSETATIGVGATDIGSGSEATTIGLVATDTGTGTESATIAAQITASDTAAGTDAATVDTGTPISGADAGTGTDVGSVAATLPAAETGGGADAASVAASTIAADTTAGVDVATIAASLSHADTAATTDAASVTVVGAPEPTPADRILIVPSDLRALVPDERRLFTVKGETRRVDA